MNTTKANTEIQNRIDQEYKNFEAAGGANAKPEHVAHTQNRINILSWAKAENASLIEYRIGLVEADIQKAIENGATSKDISYDINKLHILREAHTIKTYA